MLSGVSYLFEDPEDQFQKTVIFSQDFRNVGILPPKQEKYTKSSSIVVSENIRGQVEKQCYRKKVIFSILFLEIAKFSRFNRNCSKIEFATRITEKRGGISRQNSSNILRKVIQLSFNKIYEGRSKRSAIRSKLSFRSYMILISILGNP